MCDCLDIPLISSTFASQSAMIGSAARLWIETPTGKQFKVFQTLNLGFTMAKQASLIAHCSHQISTIVDEVARLVSVFAEDPKGSHSWLPVFVHSSRLCCSEAPKPCSMTIRRPSAYHDTPFIFISWACCHACCSVNQPDQPPALIQPCSHFPYGLRLFTCAAPLAVIISIVFIYFLIVNPSPSVHQTGDMLERYALDES